MERDEVLRDVVEKEIERYRVLLLYKERQELKRGEFEEIARTLLRRMKRGYWGIAILIVIVATWGWPHGSVREGVDWGGMVQAVVMTAVWICLITYMAHGWGRLSGSMTAVLSMLGKDEEAEGRADAT